MPNTPHTLSEFEDGLKSTREKVLLMASAAAQNLEHAIQGLLDRDASTIQRSQESEQRVNNLEREIDEEGMEVLWRFNPLATDLRAIVGAMKIATNLERISDEAENIARRGKKLTKREELPVASWIEPIYEIAARLLSEATRAYAEGDLDLALSLHEKDKELDELHSKTIKRLTKAMETDIENLRSYLHLIFVVRCLERIGDHSVNIGEEVVYILKATDIRHVGPSALEG